MLNTLTLALNVCMFGWLLSQLLGAAVLHCVSRILVQAEVPSLLLLSVLWILVAHHPSNIGSHGKTSHCEWPAWSVGQNI